MDSLLIFIAILVAALAFFLLNKSGSLEPRKEEALASVLLLLTGLACTASVYGGLRGFVVYLAMLSLLGIFYISLFVSSKNER